jgi:hypothetical protein
MAMIGRDSVFGALAAFNGWISRTNAIVRLPGTASVLDADHLRFAANESAQFRNALLLHGKRQFGAVLARHCGRMVAVGHGSNFYVYAYAQS